VGKHVGKGSSPAYPLNSFRVELYGVVFFLFWTCKITLYSINASFCVFAEKKQTGKLLQHRLDLKKGFQQLTNKTWSRPICKHRKYNKQKIKTPEHTQPARPKLFFQANWHFKVYFESCSNVVMCFVRGKILCTSYTVELAI
jgi:hypothetical protein